MPVLRCERKPQCPEERTSNRRSIFLAKDNRHNLLQPCVTCITLLYVSPSNYSGHFKPRRFPKKTGCPSRQRVKRPRKNGLRLRVILHMAY